MNKATVWMEEKVLPVALKLANQRHLLAIRDGFLAMLALTMVSALCTFFIAFPNETLSNFLTTNSFGMALASIANTIIWGSFTFMALLISFSVGQSLWRWFGHSDTAGGLVATASFLIVSAKDVVIKPEVGEAVIGSGLAAGQFGATSLFTSIVISLISVEMLARLSKCNKLVIKLPEQVPPEVAKSFATMFPGMITVISMGVFDYLVKTMSEGMLFNDIIVKVLQTPLTNMADSLGAAIIYPFLIGLFWTFGLHGSSVVNAVASPVLSSLSAENLEMAQTLLTDTPVPLDQFNIATGGFYAAFEVLSIIDKTAKCKISY